MYNISANTNFTGKTLVYLPTCHSTNEEARLLLIQGNPPEGTVIITSNQTAGKGQRGNSWEAAAGKNLTLSLILRPEDLEGSKQFILNIITSLAVCATLTKFLREEFKVKWPNDIYLKNNKICGILIENSLRGRLIKTSIVGIGLNINQEAFIAEGPISMKMISGSFFSLEEVLVELLERFEHYYVRYKENKIEELYKEYERNLFGIGEKRRFRSHEIEFEGLIQGVELNGKLCMQTDNGIQKFDYKEVEFILC